jgi:aconitate hydratase
MGILPLQFQAGENRQTLGLSGEEIYSIDGIAKNLTAGKLLACRAQGPAGTKIFTAICRIDTPVELAYYRHGGILRYVLRELLKK